jgi:hypothetical protein
MSSKCDSAVEHQISPADRYGETNLHLMKECLFSFPVAFGLQKDSPFTASFARTIQRIEEAGFIGKFTRDSLEEAAKSVSAPYGQKRGLEIRAMLLDDLQAPLLAWVMLNACGLVVFVVELLADAVARRDQGKQSKL